MSLRRDLSGLALFLVMSGSLTASEPAKRLEVKWSELGGMIGGPRVTLQLADGERVAGRVKGVTATSLVVRVKKTSDLLAYPKRKIQIPKRNCLSNRGPTLQRQGGTDWRGRGSIHRHSGG